MDNWEFHGVGPDCVSLPGDNGYYNLYDYEPVDPENINTISNYQDFVNQNWLTPHCTEQSAQSFTDKVTEEIEELRRAYAEADDKDTRDIISETGDVLFCLTAIASNASVDVNKAIIKTINSRKGQKILGKQKLDIAHHSDLSFHDLEKLYETAAESSKPKFNVGRLKQELKILNDQAERQYSNDNVENYVNLSIAIGETVSKTILMAGLMAKQRADIDFSDIIEQNVDKITGRVQTGGIDKNCRV
jgi:NTP pyrophosphatase (non-canonical NTP hydrolase)